jgi:cell division initiation protein
MMSARAQQREILQQAHDAAEAAESAVRAAVPAQGSGGAPGYVTPIPEIEYVRTFARVAQVQLRSVLDALTEQVDKLGDIPQLSEGPSAPPPSGEVSWTATVPKAG